MSNREAIETPQQKPTSQIISDIMQEIKNSIDIASFPGGAIVPLQTFQNNKTLKEQSFLFTSMYKGIPITIEKENDTTTFLYNGHPLIYRENDETLTFSKAEGGQNQSIDSITSENQSRSYLFGDSTPQEVFNTILEAITEKNEQLISKHREIKVNKGSIDNDRLGVYFDPSGTAKMKTTLIKHLGIKDEHSLNGTLLVPSLFPIKKTLIFICNDSNGKQHALYYHIDLGIFHAKEVTGNSGEKLPSHQHADYYTRRNISDIETDIDTHRSMNHTRFVQGLWNIFSNNYQNRSKKNISQNDFVNLFDFSGNKISSQKTDPQYYLIDLQDITMSEKMINTGWEKCILSTTDQGNETMRDLTEMKLGMVLDYIKKSQQQLAKPGLDKEETLDTMRQTVFDICIGE